MSIYKNLSEALGIEHDPACDEQDDNVYNHIMCRVPGVPHDEISKKLISDKTKLYWNSPEGQEKKKRLIVWNKKTKSQVMKKMYEERPEIFYRGGRTIGAKDLQKRKPSVRRKPRKVNADGVVYNNIYEASSMTGLTVSGVKKRCQRKSFGWSYICD